MTSPLLVGELPREIALAKGVEVKGPIEPEHVADALELMPDGPE